MRAKDLFSYDYTIVLPGQDQFPLNISQQGRNVREILLKDIRRSDDYIIITGFTSLSNLIEIFGSEDYPKLKKLRVVIGYDPDERVSKRLPHYALSAEIKNYWLKQNVSIRLCGPILNLIEQIKCGRFDFKVRDKLHAKIYIGDDAAVLGSSNFSKSGIFIQTEANIRMESQCGVVEDGQFRSTKQIAEYFLSIAEDYNESLIQLLNKLLKDATWQEAIARAVSEILDSKWMKDYPALYQALINSQLWPSQRIGISSAMRIIQDRGRVLIADPTGSGKTKFATALAYTVYHWLWENGLRDRTNALIISPKQVMDNWEREQHNFKKLFNKIESMGRLSHGDEKLKKQLHKEIANVDILVVDEAHNFLHRGTMRSKAINPKGSTHVLLSTATPINKKAEDLLRLIELLDIDNLNDEDLNAYKAFRRKRRKGFTPEELDKLKVYINKFIVRRTKRELNTMIQREPEQYRNRFGNICKYPHTVTDTYATGENANDRLIALQIAGLCVKLRGVHYLRELTVPAHIKDLDERKRYVQLRFNSAPALASFMVRSALRSSCCALMEYLSGTAAAVEHYRVETDKSKPSGNIAGTVLGCKGKLPKFNFPVAWLEEPQRWILELENYDRICEEEVAIYNEISGLVLKLSGERERQKAKTLMDKAGQYHKILAFDSTIITLDYLKKLLQDQNCKAEILIASGQNEKNRALVKEYFALGSSMNRSLIALCSDAMSEGINLPDAKALFLLDMPSVLRVIEQRIGRIERMDSEHEEVHVYWPDDSEEFSLRGDKRMLDILVVTDKLIGNNVDIPQVLYDRYLKDDPSAQNFMKLIKEYADKEQEWTGVKDSTLALYQLIDGEDALIDIKTYEMFRDVDATVKTAISFVESDTNWSFFAFRGDAKRSPKWLFIDEKNHGHTDFSEIAHLLKKRLSKKEVIQRKWSEVDAPEEIRKIVYKLRSQELALLPPKKQRALTVGHKILKKKFELSTDVLSKGKMEKLLTFFADNKSHHDDYIDYNHFADLWIQLLVPALDLLKENQKKKTKILTLTDLTENHLELSEENLDWLLDNSQYASTLDEIIAACIIGVKAAPVTGDPDLNPS